MKQSGDNYTMPASAVRLVEAVCGDYARRCAAIKNGSAKGAVLDKYIELNVAVETALENVEIGIRGELLRDIAIGRGYNRSAVSGFVARTLITAEGTR